MSFLVVLCTWTFCLGDGPSQGDHYLDLFQILYKSHLEDKLIPIWIVYSKINDPGPFGSSRE